MQRIAMPWVWPFVRLSVSRRRRCRLWRCRLLIEYPGGRFSVCVLPRERSGIHVNGTSSSLFPRLSFAVAKH